MVDDFLALSIARLDGTVLELGGIAAASSLKKLHERVGELTGIPLDDLKLYAGAQILSSMDCRLTLEAVGITHESMLTAIVSVKFPAIDTFEDLGLQEDLLHGIYSCGFNRPSAFQQKALRPILDGRNTVGLARNGSGKTAAFVIGALHRIDFRNPMCQSLILAPTLELAWRIQRLCLALGARLGITCRTCTGAKFIDDDIAHCRHISIHAQHCVVGTPRGVFDMMRSDHLRVYSVGMLVLVNADLIFSSRFVEEFHQVFDRLKSRLPKMQVCLSSTTSTPDILHMTSSFMRDSVHVRVENEHSTLEGIRQFYVDVEKDKWKLDTLCDLYETFEILATRRAIIYCNNCRKAGALHFLADQLDSKLKRMMCQKDAVVATIHAELNLKERASIMRNFRSGSYKVLISSDPDLLCQGVDMPPSLIINYDLPWAFEAYLQRIGRCIPASRKGIAINFVTNDDEREMQSFELYFNTQIEKLQMDSLT